MHEFDKIFCYQFDYVAVTPRRVALTYVQCVVKFCHTPDTIDARFSYVLRTLYTSGERSNPSWHVLTR